MIWPIRTGTTPRNPTHEEIAIREFTNTDLTPELSRQQAAIFLDDKKLLQNIRGLAPEDQERFVERVDQAYPTIDPRNVKFINVLGDVCRAHMQLPTSAILSAGLDKRGDVAITSGGLTDIWPGEYRGAQVTIKVFRIHPSQKREKAKEILWKRVPIWRRLYHENILPFHGVDMILFPLALVYDWEGNGDINQYIVSHPEASRLCLLLCVAKGLQYLHSLDIPHGDLRGANVVVDQGGHPRLAGYGLAPVNSDPSLTVGATPRAVVNTRWLAPELISPSCDANGILVVESKPADVFAFAMLSWEVFTGRIPLEKQKNEVVALSMFRGSRPERPKSTGAAWLTDGLWEMLVECWGQNPKERPTMEEVVWRWQKFVGHNNDGNVVTEKPPTADRPPGTSRLQARTETAQSQTKLEAPPFRSVSDAVRLRTVSQTISIRTEFVQRGTMSEPVKPRTEPRAPPPKPKRRNWSCGLF